MALHNARRKQMGTKSTTIKTRRPNGKADGHSTRLMAGNLQRGQYTVHADGMDVCFGEEPAIAGFLEGFGERLFDRFYRDEDRADPAAQMAYCRKKMAGMECRLASAG
jgi:hypothetical protein